MTPAVFDIGGTRAYAAVRIRRILFGWPMASVLGAGLLVFGGIAAGTGRIAPLVAFFLLAGFGLHAASLFIAERLEDETLPETDAASLLSVAVIRALRSRTMTGGDMLRAALVTERGRFMLAEMGIDAEKVMERCAQDVDASVDVISFLTEAAKRMREFGETRIDANIILFLLFTRMECCRALLDEADLSDDDLAGMMRWEAFHHRFRRKESRWTAASIRRNASLGRSWMMGYTDALDALTSPVDATAHATGEMSAVIHREAIDAVMRLLSRGKRRNVLLMGKVGVGKETLVGNIAITLRALERGRHDQFTRVLMLHTERLLSGVQSPDSFLLSALARAQKSGHFILVIRDLALLLRSADGNLKTVLQKCLEAENMTVIGIADTRDYHALIKTDAGLDSRFEKVTVDDATDEETMTVLMAHYFMLEKRGGVRVTYKALRTIIELSRRYLSARGGFPGIAIDVMDDAVHRALEQRTGDVNEDLVRAVVSGKSNVNVQKVGAGEKERLIGLEDRLKARIIGQDGAVRAVAAALKRARMDLSDRKRPVGTFLFLGPTGVGKTQTAKVLAEEYFGSADAMIRLDMNEYAHADAVLSIAGSPAAGEGFLAQRVQDKPFSLILLDEIEKAHPSVLNLFLQILDEGFLHDGRGMRTDFRNTIIIATSNAGALFIRDFIRENPAFDKARFKEQLIETVLREKLFTPEFMNRFDEIALYYPLSQDDARSVAILMLDEIIGDIRSRRGVEVTMEEDVVRALVDRGYSPEFGAREMRRTITGIIEDYLADYLLTHDVRRGERILIKKDDLKW